MRPSDRLLSSASAFGLMVLLALAAAPTGAAAASRTSVMKNASDVPVGIRVGTARVMARPGDVETRNSNPVTVIFADNAGRPLYTLTEGAVCANACLEQWRPAIAPKDAVAMNYWTLAELPSGERQWVFNGRPAYTAAEGKRLDMHIDLPEWNQTPFRASGTPSLEIREAGDEMRLMRLTPKDWIKTPFSIGIVEYRVAPGQMLAVGMTTANTLGQPLYRFSGTPEQEKALPRMFSPLYASGMSQTMGDFTIREREDATRQWAYQGSPLYTCNCDVSTGDLNGEGAAPGISPALVLRYPMPAQVAIKKDALAIGRMVEARTGMTLYFRDRALEQYAPDHLRPPQGTMDPGIGAQLGMAHCDAKCEREWRPLFAPADAQAHGYWSIYERPDGKRQWAYKNSAIYTHATEAPGSLDGNEQYLIQFEDGYGNEALPMEFGMGLMWRAVVP